MTGKLGSKLSLLSRIVLGGLDSGGTQATVGVRANIYGRVTQTVTARANLSGRNVRTGTAQAHLGQFLTVARDRFDRADTVSPHHLGQLETGQTWNEAGATGLSYGIQTDRAYAASGSSGGGAVVEVGMPGSVAQPLIVQADLFNVGTSGTGIIYRSDGLTPGMSFEQAYYIKVSGVYRLQIWHINAGSGGGGPFYDQPVSSIAINDNEWHTMAVRLDGNRVRIYLDGNLEYDYSSSGNYGHTQHGFTLTDNTLHRADNFLLQAAYSFQTVTAKATIAGGTATRVLQARANVRNRTPQAVQALARITHRAPQTVQARAYLQPAHFGQMSARAKIFGTSKQTVQALARITLVSSRTVTAKATIQPPRVTVQAMARITLVSSQTVTARARMTPQTTQQVTALARVSAANPRTIAARARIVVTTDLRARARLRNAVALTLPVQYNIGVKVQTILACRFDVGTTTRAYTWTAAKAAIRTPVTTVLPVEFDIAVPLPALPVVRPTQRTSVRGRRTVMARARIAR